MPISLNALALVAKRWQPSARFVERAALATVVMAVIITVTGGAVRLTQSGLGCTTWPNCTPESLTPTKAMGINGIIEFTNRLLTYVLIAVVGAAIASARSRAPWRHGLTRLGWVQFWAVMGNAVVGGIVVLTGLNPYIVGSHFLLTTVMLTAAVVMWHRAGEGDGPVHDLVGRPLRQLSWLLVAATAALIVVGTAVTGTGPHAGDAHKVTRIPIDWRSITQLHVDFVYIVVGLTIALWFALRTVNGPALARRRTVELFVVLMAQGVVGYTQYFTHLPVVLVGIHMLGSCLVWIAALRVALALRERPARDDRVEIPTQDPAFPTIAPVA